MRNFAATALSITLATTPVMATEEAPNVGSSSAIFQQIQDVSPALDKYTREAVIGGLWQRPGLSQRDRSIVTLAALIARNHTAEMAFHVNHALDNGVTAAEISEIITHLAFYSGWGNALSAVAITRGVFAERGITSADLPEATPSPLTMKAQ